MRFYASTYNQYLRLVDKKHLKFKLIIIISMKTHKNLLKNTFCKLSC